MFNYNKFDRFTIRKCAPFTKNRKCIFPVRKGFKIHPHPGSPFNRFEQSAGIIRMQLAVALNQ